MATGTAKAGERAVTDAYTTRRHASEEMAAVAELHNQVFDTWGPRADEQLRWKYIENPFFHEVTLMTATCNGDVVGMLGMMPQQVTVNRKPVLAFQACDAAVHPDHRRNGLLSRMFRSFLSYARGTDAKLCTGFTNEPATRAFVEQGWTRTERDRYVLLSTAVRSGLSLGDPTTYPSALLGLGHAVGVGTISAATRRIARVRAGDGWTVECRKDPPVGILADLSGQGVAGRAHATRSAEFYRWRLSEPVTEFRTHLLSDGASEPVCGIVTSQSESATLLRDVVPLDGGDSSLLSVLVGSLLEDCTATDRVVALDGFPQPAVLFGQGFLPPSLNLFTPTSCTFITRPLAQDDHTVHGLDVTASETWSPLHIERDF